MQAFTRRSALRAFAMTGTALSLPAGLGQPLATSGDRRTLTTSERKGALGPLMEYLRENAPKLLRAAQGPLKHPSIAPSLPGKEYSAELWDWDTLWTARGLFRFANVAGDKTFHQQVAEHATGSLKDFLEHQAPEGRLPIMINAARPEDGRLPYTAPNYQNQAKPVMFQLALLIAHETGSDDGLADVFGPLMRFHDSWYLGNMTGSGLFVWGDDVSIGNDNDPSTFGRPFFSSANILLNSFFYQDLRAAQTIAKRLNRPAAEQDLIAQRMDALGKAIQAHCWDDRDAFYYTADVQCVDRRSELLPGVPQGMAMSWSTIPIRIQQFTGFLPMWCGLPTHEQAAALMERNYLADTRLRANYGVRSLSNLEPMYSLAASGNPSNWLGPVWIIGNYLVWKGLLNYGYQTEADELASKTVQVIADSLAKDGSLNEYYHPDTGAPLSHKGFMDWNMLVLEMI